MANIYQTDRFRRRIWVNILRYYTTPTLSSSKVARAEQTRVRLTSHRIPCTLVQDINCVPARRRSGVHERKLIESLPPSLLSFLPSVPPLPKEATMHVTELIYQSHPAGHGHARRHHSGLIPTFEFQPSSCTFGAVGTCAGYRFQHSTASGTDPGELPCSYM